MKITLIAFLIIISTLFAVVAPSAQDTVHTTTGEIAAIDLQHDTVVVEVPVEEGSLTVGGPLLPEATIHKGGRKAELNDFAVGEKVKISWEKTEETHVIHRLIAAK